MTTAYHDYGVIGFYALIFVSQYIHVLVLGSETLCILLSWLQAGHNLTGAAVQFATQDQINATQVQRCISNF